MEILIADDGSDDGSLELIQRYAEKDLRIRWWRNPANLGLAGNFNCCLRAARGRYIKYVLQDDLLLVPSAIRQMTQALDVDPTVSLVGSASYVITANYNLIQSRDHFRQTGVHQGMKVLIECLKPMINLIGEPTVVMFRRAAAGRGYDERYRQLIDLDFWFHLLTQGNFAYIAEPLSAFRRHAAQETEANQRSGTGAQDEILLKKIYYQKTWEAGLVTRQMLFDQIRRLRKSSDEPTVDLRAKLKQILGKGWFVCYTMRYRVRQFLQDLKFWRRESQAVELLPHQLFPVPVTARRGEEPLVSVLVPVYNGAKYLAACLDSILAQDFADMEILIADDGSDDGSLELIQRYAEKDLRIRWWRNPANLGLAGNFNCCLRAARGRYIKYVLQDDLLLNPVAIWKMVGILDIHPTVALAGSASYLLDAQSNRVQFRNSFQRSGVIDGKAAILHCLAHKGNYIGEPTVVMFRREQAACGYDERYRHFVDLDFWYRLLERGRFAYLAEPLCGFRQHAEQKSAVNCRSGVDKQEELMMAQYWLCRPWLCKLTGGRRILFEQIRDLQKSHKERAQPFIRESIISLGLKLYLIYWLKYKITSPFKNLSRSIRKKFAKQQQSQTKNPQS